MSGENLYLGVSGWCLDSVWIVYLRCLESVLHLLEFILIFFILGICVRIREVLDGV